MPTLVTGISTERGPVLERCRSAGFSLLELLVVVAIIGIFVGVAVLSIGITGNDRESEHQISRLKTILDLVREEALMQNRDFGVFFSGSAYRFYTYDYQLQSWLTCSPSTISARRSHSTSSSKIARSSSTMSSIRRTTPTPSPRC